MTTRVYIGTTNRHTAEEHPMTTANPSRTRATSNYTLTLTVPDSAAVLPLLHEQLEACGLTCASTTLDADHAGVAWRSEDDARARRTAGILAACVEMHGHVILDRRLHTGYGIHTREVAVAAEECSNAGCHRGPAGPCGYCVTHCTGASCPAEQVTR